MGEANKEVMKEVAVVIPVYKVMPSESEIKSFRQCLAVLGNYPIILVAPLGLNTQFYDEIADKKLVTVSFDNQYFLSTKGYSELLLSRLFYNRFISFTSILIYQLDAWVFRDELSYWCSLDYDYIGAPWLDAPPIPSGKKPLINFSNLLRNKVGNGGFSLRKVKPHLKWAVWASFIFKFIPKNEDIIWTLFVPFKKPNVLKALSFAFELEPEKAYNMNGKKLPFGCHAWEKYSPEFWNKITEGFSLNTEEN